MSNSVKKRIQDYRVINKGRIIHISWAPRKELDSKQSISVRSLGMLKKQAENCCESESVSHSVFFYFFIFLIVFLFFIFFIFLFFLIVFLLVTQSYLTLCDPTDWDPPGFSVCGIFWARILEWVAVSFSRGIFPTRDLTWVSCTARRFFTSKLSGKQRIRHLKGLPQ